MVLSACSGTSPDPGPAVTSRVDIYRVSTEPASWRVDAEMALCGQTAATSEVEEPIGYAEFVYRDKKTRLTVELFGMEPRANHAMHLHVGTLENPGAHWNQGSVYAFCDSVSMGKKWNRPFAGDVGNINIGTNGNGIFKLTTNLWSVGTGDHTDVLGLVLMVHEDPEDFAMECDPNHTHDGPHVNARLGGGVVVLMAEAFE
jgi:superoxide dismutase, Cu-Zn family